MFIFYPFPKRKDVIFKSWRVGRRRSKRGCSTLLIGNWARSGSDKNFEWETKRQSRRGVM